MPFSFQIDKSITPFRYFDDSDRQEGVVKAARAGKKVSGEFQSDSKTELELSDQFIVFQFNHELSGPTIVESADVNPGIEGSQENPDVLVALEMLSFHLAQNEDVDQNSRATLRINFGKDESSTDKLFDTVFWSIAAGLRLYDDSAGDKTSSKDLNTDFRQAFGNRPIEVPGGLGLLSFEVVKHEEPPWWKRIFGFLKSDTADSLMSVLGFPAITTKAIEVLDELLNRIDDGAHEVLFKSLPMRLALSDYARNEFTGGNPRVRVGALRKGFCILSRGRDFAAFNESDLIYYPTYGKLAPPNLSTGELFSGKYEDLLEDVTYAIFRIGTKETRLDPTFDFRA